VHKTTKPEMHSASRICSKIIQTNFLRYSKMAFVKCGGFAFYLSKCARVLHSAYTGRSSPQSAGATIAPTVAATIAACIHYFSRTNSLLAVKVTNLALDRATLRNGEQRDKTAPFKNHCSSPATATRCDLSRPQHRLLYHRTVADRSDARLPCCH